LGVLGKKIIGEGRDIDKEHLWGKPAGRRSPAHDNVIVSIHGEELVDDFRI